MRARYKESFQEPSSSQENSRSANGKHVKDFDAVLHNIGEFGRAQLFFFVLICYGSSARAILAVAQVFLGKVPKFHCDGRINEDDDPCQTSCKKYIFDKTNFTSIVSEWDLVCENKEYVGLVQSTFMLGILLGSIFIGPLADQYGRRVVMTYAHIGMALFHFMAAASQTYLQFVISRFLVGFLAAASISSCAIYEMENSHSSWRTLLNIIHGTFYGFGIAILALFAYYFRAWRDLVFYSNFALLLFIGLLWFLPESPRWLASQGRLAEAEAILIDMANKNGVTVSHDMVSLSEVMPTKCVPQTGSLLDSFRTSEIRRRMMILMCAWMACTMCYFGLTLGSSNLGGNMYLTVALSGLVELPSKVIGGLVNIRFGRKFALAVSLLLGSVCCFAVVLSPRMSGGEMSSLQTTMAMIGKMGISAAFNTIFVYTGELLPTVIRSSAFSLCSMTGRVAGIIGPLIASSLGDNAAFVTYGLVCFIAGSSCLYLPETLNKPLPDTVTDVEQQALIKIKDT